MQGLSAGSEPAGKAALPVHKNRTVVEHCPQTRQSEEIDLIASEGKNYLIGECKWRNELMDATTLSWLREKADVFCAKREKTWFILFSKSGFTQSLKELASRDGSVILADLKDVIAAGSIESSRPTSNAKRDLIKR